MHQNVKETNEELKEKKPEGKKRYMTHKKSPSGSSTSSNLSVQLRRSSGAATDMQVPIALKLPLGTFINANLAILATARVFYWSLGVCLGH